MGEHSNEPCWKIMKCDASKDCVGRNRLETSCWEIVTELDFRHALISAGITLCTSARRMIPALPGKR